MRNNKMNEEGLELGKTLKSFSDFALLFVEQAFFAF